MIYLQKALPALVVAAAFALAALPSAQALPSLRLSDGVQTITITDELFDDVSGFGDMCLDVPGAVLFVGDIGSWHISMTVGFSKPLLGSATDPHLILGSMVASSSGAGTLSISFSDNWFEHRPATLSTSIGGEVTSEGGMAPNNTLAYRTYADVANELFVAPTTTLLTCQGFGAGEFSGAASSSLDFPGFFSLTQEVIIFHETAGVSSFTAGVTVSVPDGGSTLALLGLSLVGIERIRRRLRF